MAPRVLPSSAAATPQGKPRSGLARGGALVTLIHGRADLGETMSDYLIHELDRYGVAVRNRSEIAALQGANGQLEAVALEERREQLPFSFLFFFLSTPNRVRNGSTTPSSAQLDGFILTGEAVGADNRTKPFF